MDARPIGKPQDGTMTDRIKEIIDKVSKEVYISIEFDDGTVHEGYEFSEDELRLFIKQIARECIDICEQQRIKILNDPADPSWTEHLADVQNNIKQHFGVSE